MNLISWEEVGKNAASNWIVIDDKVIDPTSFMNQHPGGPAIIRNRAGKDVTRFFNNIGHSEGARKQMESLKVGMVDSKTKPASWQVDQDINLMKKLSVIIVIAVVAIAVYAQLK